MKGYEIISRYDRERPIVTVYGFETLDDARDAAIHECVTFYPENKDILYRLFDHGNPQERQGTK